MTRLLAILAIASVSVPGIAAAQSAPSGRLDIVGVAPSACVLQAPTAMNGSNASFQARGTNSGEIRIVEMVDPVSAQPRAVGIDLLLPVICNSPHRLALRSGNGGLRHTGAASANSSFSDFLPYKVAASWAGQDVSGQTDAGQQVVINSNSGAAGQASVSVNVPGGGSPLLAGGYEDSIVIEFQVAN